MTPEYLTVAEAAERADRDRQTIRRWFRDGLLTRYRVGPRGVRVKTAELDELMGPRPVAPGAVPFANR